MKTLASALAFLFFIAPAQAVELSDISNKEATGGLDETQLRAIGTGPLMSRYSKGLEYDYSATLRAELIAEATAANRAAIDGALAMLANAAEKSPILARALGRSGGG